MTLRTNFALSDTITFDFITSGPAVVTLSTLDWSSISGIRKGFRIITDGGLGEAILDEDPQFQSKSVNVIIIKDLSGFSYAPNNWDLFVPASKKIGDYVPRSVKPTLLLPEYWESVQDIFIDELQDCANRIRNIRRWEAMDQEYLDVFLQTLGMFFKSETFDTETKRRFIKELPAFLEMSGTKYTFNYLSFVVGALFEVKQLWSKDYKAFILVEDIPPAEIKDYYPTNHVQLTFDSEVFGVIDPSTVLDIFYVLASLPLVLQSINQGLIAEELIVNATLAGMYEAYYTASEV